METIENTTENNTWNGIYIHESEMTLFIRPEITVKEYYENHTTYHDGDSGIDLFTPSDVIFQANELGKMVDLKIACEFYDVKKCELHHENKSYYLYPRSSISKTPLRLSNSVGIIDSGYRGNIIMALDNLSSENYTLKKGTRLVQICAGDLNPFKTKIVSELSNSSRGSGGFGSTN